MGQLSAFTGHNAAYDVVTSFWGTIWWPWSLSSLPYRGTHIRGSAFQEGIQKSPTRKNSQVSTNEQTLQGTCSLEKNPTSIKYMIAIAVFRFYKASISMMIIWLWTILVWLQFIMKGSSETCSVDTSIHYETFIQCTHTQTFPVLKMFAFSLLVFFKWIFLSLGAHDIIIFLAGWQKAYSAVWTTCWSAFTNLSFSICCQPRIDMSPSACTCLPLG